MDKDDEMMLSVACVGMARNLMSVRFPDDAKSTNYFQYSRGRSLWQLAKIEDWSVKQELGWLISRMLFLRGSYPAKSDYPCNVFY